MSDESTPKNAEDADDSKSAGTATAAPEKDGEDRLNQQVDIRDIGPCKKHIRVSVNRGDIDKLINDKISELVKDAVVPGFRPGKAPRKVIQRKFNREVTNEIRGQLLLASLEQLAEDHDIAPLSAPEIDPDSIFIPNEGPFVYEFDVEVRPHFDLPDYKGLKLKRPVRDFTDDDVTKEERRILARFGQLVPKEKGKIELEDYITVDMQTRVGDKTIGTMRETVFRVDERLSFKDGVAESFAAQVVGAKAGDKREIDITLSDAVASPELKGKTVKAILEIKDLKHMRLPELTEDLFERLGVHNADQLHEQTRILLEKRLEYQQRQSVREQVLGLIANASQWDLPHNLLQRQARKHFERRVMEMKEAGMSDDEILARRRMLEQDVIQSTALALKEHFVLQKIAEVEKLEVTEDEIAGEIERLADLESTTPRRVRARLEKEDLLEILGAQIVERKALDLILESAKYEDMPLDVRPVVPATTVDAQAVPGEMADPTAPPPEPEKSEQTDDK